MVDARFVARLAESLELPCELSDADVKCRMRECGESLETAARHARHEFFGRCALKYRCRRFLLAHHADDQAETVLWNLLRGSHGAKGMREIQTIRTGNQVTLEIQRPLLTIRGGELVLWLESRGIRWREDASNAKPIAVRNRIRHEIIPLLAEIADRDPVAALVRMLDDWRELEEISAWAVGKAAVIDPQGRLHLPEWRKLPPAMRCAVMADFLKSRGVVPERAVLERAIGMTDVKQPAAINLTGRRRLRRSSQRLWIES
jgi:tRNA(Ile)-lysidine synthase